ncbi:MAG TPA: ribonuclease domain-containing protein [Candidatus Acidoferrum sp.]|nr:ribonuclease domain-containing protein [Candidatus Acidoferrum sp.]
MTRRAGAEGFKAALLFGGLPAAVNHTLTNGVERMNVRGYGVQLREAGQVDTLIQEALKSPAQSEAHRRAVILNESGREPTDAEIGRLYAATVAEAGKMPAVEAAEQSNRVGSFDELPANAQGSYRSYEMNGWKGNYGGQAPGTKAGKVYRNADELLPKMDLDGNMISYREFDINSPAQGIGRDVERFVVGSDGSVYYTDSHYGQGVSAVGLPPFIKIK